MKLRGTVAPSPGMVKHTVKDRVMLLEMQRVRQSQQLAVVSTQAHQPMHSRRLAASVNAINFQKNIEGHHQAP